MSTKIYVAWRCKKEKINEVLDLTQEQVFKYVCSYKFFKSIPLEGFAEIFNETFSKCVKASKSMTRDPVYDIDFGLNMWFGEDEYVYIIPVGETRISASIKFPDWVEDFSYWDNSDAPKGISEEEFNVRGDIWKKVCVGSGKYDWNSRRFWFEITNAKTFETKYKISEFLRNNA